MAASLRAHASGLTGDTLDAVANGMSWFVICVIPIVGIALFWMVHVMPEKIAHKRHHPQAQAIHVLCLLSLVFGGLLWPLAWLWAYSRPTAYRLAYGTDKHVDYHLDMAEKARAGQLTDTELAHLREELDAMQARGALPPELTGLRAQLDVAASSAANATAGGAA
jgi:CBS domain containing-hemolysin-like protein